MLGPVGLTLLEKLGSALAPVAIRLEDQSHRHAGHAGARPDGESHFAVSIVSPAFAGKRPLERHRMVNEAVAEELRERVHALAIRAEPARGDVVFTRIAAHDPRLAALLAECGLAGSDLTTPRATFVGLASGTDLLACGGIEVIDGVALLQSVAVAKNARGQGHSQAIVLRLLDEARKRGVGEIWLLTQGAERFFAGLGFVAGDRAATPAAIQATAQFTGTRCASAVAMRRAL